MIEAYGVTILNDAISQQDRLSGAPAPDAVRVDGRSLAQLLAFGAQYGALVQFYDLDNMPDGDWAAFFGADPAVAHALHAALDLPEIEEELQRLLIEARAAHDHHGRMPTLKRILAILSRLIAILDRRQVGVEDPRPLSTGNGEPNRIDALAAPLRRLHRHLEGRSIEDLFDHSLYTHETSWVEALADILEDVVISILSELRAGVAAAHQAVETAMASADHQPQAAIYNAFVVLFMEARAMLNRFPKRLVSYYYDIILKQRELAAEPSKLFLTFTRSDGATQASIPRGAEFLAGADSNGEDIKFAAVSALEVTPAKVEWLSVHRLTRSTLDRDGRHSVPANVLSGNVAIDPERNTPTGAFPLFGENKTGVFGALTMEHATLGFCIASPVLLLAGGVRTVSLVLSVSRIDRTERGRAMIASLVSSLDWLAQLVKSSLDLHYSTAGGWMLIDAFDVTSKVSDDSEATAIFTISFTLPADAPPVEMLSAKPAPGGPPPTRPASAFPDAPIEPAILASMKLESSHQPTAMILLSIVKFDSVVVNVGVTGLTQLTLTTPNGPATPGQNFPVLGMPPVQYAGIDIYAPELFTKPIESLSVSIPWAGLPITSTGFKGYYQNYLLDADGALATTPLFDNSVFRLTASLVNPGGWTVDSTAQPYLFQTDPTATSATPPAPDVPVRRTSVITVPGIAARATPAFYNPAASALRLSLVEPAYAFGNILYSSNMMAATQQQSAAAHGRNDHAQFGSAVQIAKLATVNATAPDKSYWSKITDAVHKAITALTGEALTAVQQAIGQSRAPADAQMSWLQDLKATLADAAAGKGGFWSRLFGGGGLITDAISVVEALGSWVSANEKALGAHAAPALNRSKQLLSAAGDVAAAHQAAKGQPATMARPSIAAASQQTQSAMQPAGLPNAPWLPMAAAVSVDYTASLQAVIQPDPIAFAMSGLDEASQPAPDAAALSTAADAAAGAGAAEPPVDLNFWHVGPFGKFKPPERAGDNGTMSAMKGLAAAGQTDGVALLPQIDSEAALYIQLSAPVPQISLLFLLSAGKDGWWDDPPELIWEEYRSGNWCRIVPLEDTTGGLTSSGIVTLQLTVEQGATKAGRLRVSASANVDGAPIVQSVIANAVTTKWIGPGGAQSLGMPLPRGTVTKSVATLAGIASIAQPMESIGGRPPATGGAFQMRMAERLRHKGYAIDCWDYARIALDAAPSLWQAAVVPATDEQSGAAAPGSVWLVVIGGQSTPNVSDPAIPQVDLATLSSIGDAFAGRMSSFARLSITNPTYLRLTVSVIVEFDEDDTGAFWCERLNTELKAWLSPWPDPALGTRPANYYARRAIAEFVRHRPYVRGIERIDVQLEQPPSPSGHYYLTSADKHNVRAAARHRSGHGKATPRSGGGLMLGVPS